MSSVKKALSNMKFILAKQLKVYPMAFAYSFGLGLIRCLTMGAMILMPKIMVDALTREAGDERLFFIVTLYAAAMAVLMYLGSVFTRFQQKSGYYLPHTLMLGLARKMTRIDYKDVESRRFNEAYTNAENAVFKLTAKGDELIRLLFSAVLEFVMIVTVVATLDWLAVLIIIISAALQIWLDTKVNENTQNFRKAVVPQLHGINYPKCVLEGFFPGMKDIITFEGGELFLHKMHEAYDEVHKKFTAKFSFEFKIRVIQYLIRGLELTAVYFILIYRFFNESISAGSLLMYITAAGELKQVLNTILAGALSVGEAEMYMRQYREVMEFPENMRQTWEKAAGETGVAPPEALAAGIVPSEVPAADVVSPKVPAGVAASPRIQFCNVSFRYSERAEYVLRNVSFTLEPGEKLVLIGENGAGKSTLIKLLLRLYDVTEGCILVNGTDIRSVDYDEYQGMFAAVFQDYQLFDCQLGENIGFENVEEDRVRNILSEVGLGKFADKLELEVHSEGGMSGGERQMVAIGRAIYKSAPVSVYDEVTSAIDPLREASIYNAIRENAGGRSLIYISHRLAVCTLCDHILLLDKGQILEYGSHEELMKKNRKYARLFSMQAEKYRQIR